MNNLIYPCLWFDGQAKEAADYYCRLFEDSKITLESDLVVTFDLYGQKFLALNGGPTFKINPSISFFLLCESVKEIDEHWQNLTKDGSVFMPLDKYDWSDRYGWVQDKFGVSWQLFLGKMEDVGQKITPTLMFTDDIAGKAEEAVNFYTSVFDNSSITGIQKYGPGEIVTEGMVKHGQFKLCDNVFMIMDNSAEHDFKINEAVSFMVECVDQSEIDYYWEKLTDGGEESMCGWLKDKFGVSWQIVPEVLGELMSDPERFQRVMIEVLKMKKLDFDKMVNA